MHPDGRPPVFSDSLGNDTQALGESAPVFAMAKHLEEPVWASHNQCAREKSAVSKIHSERSF
jgi:hypothetical protein